MAAPATEAINHDLNADPAIAAEAVAGGVPRQATGEHDNLDTTTSGNGVVLQLPGQNWRYADAETARVAASRSYLPSGVDSNKNGGVAEPVRTEADVEAPADVVAEAGPVADAVDGGEAPAVSDEPYNGLGRELRLSGAVPMSEDDKVDPQVRKDVAELRRELEEPGAVAFEKAYATVLGHYNITAADEVPADVEAEAVREGNKARAAAEAGEEVMRPVNRTKGNLYGEAREAADSDEAEPETDGSADADTDPEAGGAVGNGTDSTDAETATQEYAGRHRVEDREDSPETGFRAWTRRRFSGAMRLAKWAYDRSGLPTKEDLKSAATVGAMASTVLADQVQFEAKQLWRNEVKPGLQALVRDALGKAAMYLDSENKFGAKDIVDAGWQKYLERDAKATQLRDEQAAAVAAAEAARIQAFQAEAAGSQAEWVQNQSR